MYAPDTVVSCHTVSELAQALPADIVSLDWDLAGGTDARAALPLLGALLHSERPGRVIVHSKNIAGSERLLEGLASAGYHPERREFSYREARALLGYYPERRGS